MPVLSVSGNPACVKPPPRCATPAGDSAVRTEREAKPAKPLEQEKLKKIIKMKKKVFLGFFCLLLCSQAFGQTLVNGIYYNFSGTTASVARPPGGGTYAVSNIVIPSTVTNSGITYSVTRIEDAFAFSSDVTSVTIPESVKTIGDNAFFLSGLMSVNIPSNITSIGESAFESTKITEIDIPSGVVSIGKKAFQFCANLTSITIPNSITNIEESTFHGCGQLATIIIPETVMSIGNNAFYNTVWYNNQPDGIVYAGNVLYKYKGNMPINAIIDTIKETTVSITPNAFTDNYYRNNNLVAITIPQNVVSIGSFCWFSSLVAINVESENTTFSSENGVLFDKNKETLICFPQKKSGNYVIPSSIKTIASLAFNYCSDLISVTMPSSVTSINGSVFQGCSGLVSIINLNPVPLNDGRVTLNPGVQLYVPTGKKNDYQNSTYWQYCNIVELPEISENDIVITPSDENALIEWQPFDNAEGYRIIIYSDEAHTDTIFILEFDADGEWFNTISFRSASANLSHTIENLQGGTDYFYTLEILGVGCVMLASQSGEFTTENITGILEAESVLSEVIGYYSVLGTKLPKAPEKGMYIVLYSNGTTQKIMK